MLPNIPNSPIVDSTTLRVSREWLQWLLNPQFITLELGSALGTDSGGTGSDAAPTSGFLLVGTGSSYEPTEFLPVSAFPGLTGDVTASAGAISTTLTTVNATPGTYGDGQNVATFTVNGKGLVTASAQTPITGAPGAFVVSGALSANSSAISGALTANSLAAAGSVTGATMTATGAITGGALVAVGGFGCNGATAQTAVSAGAAVATTAATNVTPFGYTTAAQADRIVALLNTIRAALIANGILVP